MEQSSDNTIFNKCIKIILDIFLILMGVYVLCFITYSSVRYYYFSKHGVKNVAGVSYKRDSVLLTYAVNGEQYVFDITDELKPEVKSKGVEDIYYLPQQPDKYYRVLYWKIAGYGWLFLCALIPLRFICLKIIQLPLYHDYKYEYVLFEKEIDLFPRNKRKNDGKIKDTDDLGEG